MTAQPQPTPKTPAPVPAPDVFTELRALRAEIIALRIATQPSPCYRRSLKLYPKFDWASLGAKVLMNDQVGATIVEWGGYIWLRRVGSGKFGDAIWFSRSAGKDSDGENDYYCLVKFQEMAVTVEEIPASVLKKLK